MWNENDAYFDYVEIRRRVERRLASGMVLLMHVGLYLVSILGLIMAFGRPESSNGAVWANLFMAGWSGVLLLHGLWAVRHSAVSNGPRLGAVRDEVSDRLDADDTELLADARGVFRIQSLLDEDLRLRAGWMVSLLGFILVNNAAWGITFLSRPDSGVIWHILAMLSFFALPAIYGLNKGRRFLRHRNLQRALASHPTRQREAVKKKRSFGEELDAYTRLTDDGELVDVPQDWAAYQRSRKTK